MVGDPFYVFLILGSMLYWTLAYLTEFDFILGNIGFGIPYGLFIWGILGLTGTDEPLSLLFGIFFFLSMTGIFRYLETEPSLKEEVLLKEGIVNIPIYPGEKGEVRIDHSYGAQFYVAECDGIQKPIQKGEKVYVESIEGNTLSVTQSFPSVINKTTTMKSRIRDIIKFFTPTKLVNEVCMICYGSIKSSKKMLACPECNQSAHESHLTTWLQHNNQCPNCRTILNWDDLNLTIKSK